MRSKLLAVPYKGVVLLWLLLAFLFSGTLTVSAAEIPFSRMSVTFGGRGIAPGQPSCPEIIQTYSSDDAVEFDGTKYVKLNKPEDPVVDGYIFDYWAPTASDSTIMNGLFHRDPDTGTFTNLKKTVAVTDWDNIYAFAGRYGTKFAAYFIKETCNITIKDVYYDTDGKTIIETVDRSIESVNGGESFTCSALEPSKDYTYTKYMGYYGKSGKTTTYTNDKVVADFTVRFYYTKVENPSPSIGGRIEIPVEIDKADGTTKTDFVVDNTILGGDLIVSIPAEMILSYDADNEVMVEADYVSASGRCSSTSNLEVKTLTSITYANDADNSIEVPGTIEFGVTSDAYQITEWSAAELLTGIKNIDDRVKKNITASVLKADIDFVGTYSTTILYNISVLDSAVSETP